MPIRPKLSIPTCPLKVPSHHKQTHTQRCKELPNEICPPPPDQLRLGPLCITSGNTGPSARQTSGAGPSTRRSTDYAPPLCCGHPKSHCTSVELGKASGLVLPHPKLGSQFTVFTWDWVGYQVEKERCV